MPMTASSLCPVRDCLVLKEQDMQSYFCELGICLPSLLPLSFLISERQDCIHSPVWQEICGSLVCWACAEALAWVWLGVEYWARGVHAFSISHSPTRMQIFSLLDVRHDI